MNSFKKDWVNTDPDHGQYGRQIGDGIYEFYTEGGDSPHPNEIYNFADVDDAIEIDISKFSDEDIEDIIDAFGYFIDPDKAALGGNFVEMNLSQWDKKDREWIIAECIYEINYE